MVVAGPCKLCIARRVGKPARLIVLPVKGSVRGLMIVACPNCDGDMLSHMAEALLRICSGRLCLDFPDGSSCITNDGTGLWCAVCIARDARATYDAWLRSA